MAARVDPVKQAIAREAFKSLRDADVLLIDLDIGSLACVTEVRDYTLRVSVRTTTGKRRVFEVVVKEKVW